MSEFTDLEQQLSDAFRTRAASASPSGHAWDRIVAELGEISSPSSDSTVIDIAPLARQQEASTGTRRRPRWPFAVISAAAVVVVVVLLLSKPSADEENVITNEENVITNNPQVDLGPQLTEDIPPELETGTITTPVGSARWVHLEGDSDSLPAGSAIPWPEGLAIFEPPQTEQASEFGPVEVIIPARLWVSSDGINWRVDDRLPMPPDVSAAQLSFDDGTYWMATSGPRLWRSTDGATWDEIDLGDLTPDGPEGLDWDIRLSQPVSHGVGTVARLTFRGDFPFSDFIDSPADVICAPRFELRRVTSDVYTLLDDDLPQGPDENCPQQELRFIETPTGLEVLDNATGGQLGEIAGADLTDLDRMLPPGLHEEDIVVIQDGPGIRTPSPWPAGHHDATLRAGDGRILAFTISGDAPYITAWETTDGQTWTERGRPDFAADLEPNNGLELSSLPGGPLVAQSDAGAWETTGGLDWNPAPGALAGGPGGTTPVRLGSGWFANDSSRGGGTGDGWWIHLGGTWFPLDDVGIEGGDPRVGGTGISATGISNVTFFFYRADPNVSGNQRDMWILSNEPD